MVALVVFKYKLSRAADVLFPRAALLALSTYMNLITRSSNLTFKIPVCMSRAAEYFSTLFKVIKRKSIRTSQFKMNSSYKTPHWSTLCALFRNIELKCKLMYIWLRLDEWILSEGVYIYFNFNVYSHFLLVVFSLLLICWVHTWNYKKNA